eukprot:1181207-Prorocentrum_minimum.AAC.3
MLFRRGMARAALHQYSQAMEDLSRAAALEPRDCAIRKYSQAIEDLSRAAALKPRDCAIRKVPPHKVPPPIVQPGHGGP